MTLKVADIGEKELIKYIIDNSKTIIPDDAAISNIKSGKLITTCDLLIQSKHFPEEMSYYDMGFKAVSVNVSDLAAMASKPLAFLLALAVPKDLSFDSFKQIIKGVIKACEFYSIPLIGGDLNESSEIIISGTALATSEKPVRKDTYSKGDLIVITGNIGLAALGFHLKGKDNIYTQKALKPKARIKEALKIKDYMTSSTDITDGLASELYEIKKENYGFMIYEDSLEISKEYKEISEKLKLNYLDLILHVGEDFELLFTVSPENINKLEIDYKVIGKITDSNKVEITLNDGNVLEIENRGYEHLC